MKKVKAAAIGIIILSLFLILAGGACKKALRDNGKAVPGHLEGPTVRP